MGLTGGTALLAVTVPDVRLQALALAVWTVVYGILWVVIRGVFNR